MKKILMFLLLCAVIVPSFGQMRGPDSCSAPYLYTIDKRCYVTDEQKKEYPYNAVVGVLDGSCTGTIIKDNYIYYVYTAAHCVYNMDLEGEQWLEAAAGPFEKFISGFTQDGTVFLAKKSKVGNFLPDNSENVDEDWAIYKIMLRPSDFDDVKNTDKLEIYRDRDLKDFVCEASGNNDKEVIVDTTNCQIRGADKLYAVLKFNYSLFGETQQDKRVFELEFQKIRRGYAQYEIVYRYLPSSVVVGQVWYGVLQERELFTGNFNFDIKSFDPVFNASVVGYGLLRIMSDSEIQEFQKRLVDFLYNSGGGDMSKEEYMKTINGDDSDVRSLFLMVFMDELRRNNYSYYNHIFRDFELKESKCGFSASGEMMQCQAWGGNSGGPIFDSTGSLMGILTRGNKFIGKEHAKATGAFNLQKDMFIFY